MEEGKAGLGGRNRGLWGRGKQSEIGRSGKDGNPATCDDMIHRASIMLSEVSQRAEDKCHTVSLILWHLEELNS